jgi:hypothetical protein
MTTTPNQKTVTTKSAKHDKENIYAAINIKALEVAMTMLKPNAFKLWCYMAKNQNNYTFALSAVDACSFCNFGKSTYHTAVQELIDIGYLVNTSGNHYDFYEELKEEEAPIITVKKANDDWYIEN